MLSGAQLQITVTALVVGFVAEPLIGASLGEALGGIGLPAGAGVAVSWYDALGRSAFTIPSRAHEPPTRVIVDKAAGGHRPTAVFARVRDEIGHGFGCVFVATAAG